MFTVCSPKLYTGYFKLYSGLFSIVLQIYSYAYTQSFKKQPFPTGWKGLVIIVYLPLSLSTCKSVSNQMNQT